MEPENIPKEIIWNNSCIQANNKMFFNKELFNRGIKFIEHIYDFRLKRFYNFIELRDLYNLSDRAFLIYNSLLHSIPNDWKIKLSNQAANSIGPKTCFINNMLTVKKNNRYLYQKYLEKSPEYRQQYCKTEQKWNTQFDELNWRNIYIVPFTCTIDTRLRIFQYKYLMRIIATNRYLLKCKIAPSSLCDFCNMHDETLDHLFWDCCVCQQFWSRLRSFLDTNNMNINICLQTISFGITQSNLKNTLINFIIILAKYFIFKCKLDKTLPSFMFF